MNTKVDYFDKNVNTSYKKIEICRLCGEKSLDYIPIFEDKDNYIPEKISRCLPIIIFPNDNLPSNVCRRCLNYLNISCNLILTAVEVDMRLRMQLDQREKDAFTDKNIIAEFKIYEPINITLLKELKRQAIAGPVKCDLCDLNFQDVDIFDTHMEQFHFLKWRCNLCDNSFYKSNELVAHKKLRHSGNIVICNNCQYSIDQNNKQEIINKNQNNKQKSENIHDNQICIETQKIINETNVQNVKEKCSEEKNSEYKEIIDATNVQNDQRNKQEIDEKDTQNHQNNIQKISGEKNIQNGWKIEQEIIDKNSYKKRVVTFTKNNETIASINLAMDTQNDIIEMKNKNDLASMKQTDNSSDSDTDEIIKKCKKFLERLKTLKQREQLFCNTCKIRFGDERHFKAHNKIHEKRAMICTMCSTEYSSMYNLFLHKREKHNMYKKVQLKYACNKCGKFFTHSWHWEVHNENKCSKMVNKCCKYCNTMFSTHLKLIRHLRRHKWEMFNDPTVTIYKCVACSKVFVDKEFYEKHRSVHDPKCWNKFRCIMCNRPFRDKFRLQEHQLAIHRNVKFYQCNICGRSFLSLHDMKAHRKIHFGYECSHCDAILKKKLDLMKHLQKIHDLKPLDKLSMRKNYLCRFCDKKLNTYQSLTNHERIHTGKMPFNCPICHRSFRSYTSRWIHIQCHQKGTFICEYCGKYFSYKQNLIVHISTHLPMEARKYQCDVCGKKFLRKSHLTIHKRIHNGIRPFKCDLCSLSFTQKGDMKRHRMRHFNKGKPIKTIESKEQI